MDNARQLLLNMEEEYQKRGLLCAVTDKQYGEGVTEYNRRMIQKYYGV